MLLKIIAIGVIGAIISITIKTVNKEFSKFIVIATGILILIIIVNSLGDVIVAFNSITKVTKLDLSLFTGLLKIVGIGYFTEYSANICEDLECKSIANKIQLAGKITIFLMSLPILKSLLSVIIKILN